MSNKMVEEVAYSVWQLRSAAADIAATRHEGDIPSLPTDLPRWLATCHCHHRHPRLRNMYFSLLQQFIIVGDALFAKALGNDSSQEIQRDRGQLWKIARVDSKFFVCSSFPSTRMKKCLAFFICNAVQCHIIV